MYRPLPDGLTIKESNVQGLGLFATQEFEANLVLGIVPVSYTHLTLPTKA